MIKEAMQWIGELALKTAAIEPVVVEGKTYLRGAHGELNVIRPDVDARGGHEFGTVEDLAAYLLSVTDPLQEPLVVVSPSGIVAVLSESVADWSRKTCKVPFFNADLPPTDRMSHESLMLYLDRHAGKIADEDNVRTLLNVVRSLDSKELTVQDAGASTNIKAKAERGVQAGDGAALPKYLQISLRIGTREFEEWHKFRLVVGIAEGHPVFRLVHLDRDQALDRFLTRAKEKLEAALGEGWRVYRGA